MTWHRQLHWKIIIGLTCGALYGLFAASQGWSEFTESWIAPWGEVFLNSLKLIAVPLVVGSLISSISKLRNLNDLSSVGGRTIGLYIATTAVAVSIGLLVVNFVRPGDQLSEGVQESLRSTYLDNVTQQGSSIAEVREFEPLDFIQSIVPSNVIAAATDNRNMLQIVVVGILFGIAAFRVPREKSLAVVEFFEGSTNVAIEMVNVVMKLAPIGVFAIVAGTITKTIGNDVSQALQLFAGLGTYMLTLITGLTLQVLVTYGIVLWVFSRTNIGSVIKGVAPAILIAFSTSSSAASLPVNMKRCEERLGVPEEIASFVLPLGTTINMDGTALYQSVAAVFIAQAIGVELSMTQQLTIILTATLASIGTPAVPAAGLLMLVIILESIGVPSTGIALILGIDRLLDMFRTATNVIGDATVCVAVSGLQAKHD